MIKSMTGYGGAEGECQGLSFSVELKSVNHRFLDVSVRMPRSFIFAEESLKSAVQGHISRGKVDMFVTINSSGTSDITVTVNDVLAQSYVEALKGIAKKLSVSDDITATAVGRFPDVLSVEKLEADKDSIAESLCETLEKALCSYDIMRVAEGQKLKEDIENRLCEIERMLAIVEERSPQTVLEYRERLTARMNEVLESTGLDEQRILQEAAIFADRVAVDEETVRLRSHISQLRTMLEEGSPIGRKLDFLVQEFNREANTIGSKCNDADIARVVVDLKSEVEKIREQVQNIE